jgi:type IV fimbrial biogenesis protein FimT
MSEVHSDVRQRGLTLVEACATAAVAVVLVGTAIPGFQKQMATRSLEGTANQVVSDIQFLRSEAVARNESARLTFGSVAGGTCYVMHTGHAGDCTCDASGPASCIAGAREIKSAFFPAGGVRVQSNVGSMVFAPTHGTVSPAGTIRVTAADGREVQNVVNIMGRVRSCSPGATIRGYPDCPPR